LRFRNILGLRIVATEFVSSMFKATYRAGDLTVSFGLPLVGPMGIFLYEAKVKLTSVFC